MVVGGGTGTHTVLRGLKRCADELELTAIVTMADSGGSTGRLRDEFGQLPVGDVRMALTALAASVDDHDELLRELFLYRFDRGSGLSGHNFGNLLLTALTDILGSEERAIEAASRILRIDGSVIPVTTQTTHLVATYADGSSVTGEHLIDDEALQTPTARIVELALTPAAILNPRAREALVAADYIIFGPGDLYTSIIANLVVDGFKDAVAASTASCLYVCNLMSKIGQSTGMDAHSHRDEVAKYLGRPLDLMLFNTTPIDAELMERYAAEGNHCISCALDTPDVMKADLLATETIVTPRGDTLKRSLVRHDGEKLASAIMAAIATLKKP